MSDEMRAEGAAAERERLAMELEKYDRSWDDLADEIAEWLRGGGRPVP